MERDMLSECRGSPSLADLLGEAPGAPVALLGAPLAERSLTPGRCDLAPALLRATLRRLSSYDLETGLDLAGLAVHDSGDLPLRLVSPADAFEPVSAAMAELVARHHLTLLVGGNNAITRPAVHALDPSLAGVGLLTLDAHFDLRDTDCGLTNGNPVSALLEDGLPGRHIAQIGLQPFANTRRMHERASAAGIAVHSMAQVRARGLLAIVDAELARLSGLVDSIHVDFDIDVIARHEAPGAPGARPGGLTADEFFAAARRIAAHPKVRSVDLAEFDPALDVGNLTALVAARWFGDILAGFHSRPAA